MAQAVFLDRDGVLNDVLVHNRRPVGPTLAQFRINQHAPRALAALRSHGYLLICVTNQPNVPRGVQSIDDIEAMHDILRRELPLSDILVCYHDDHASCPCRKPNPGLLHEAAAKHDIDLARSFMIGDRWKDTEAGKRAGCVTVLIDRDYDDPPPPSPPDAVVREIDEAAAWILRYTFP